MKYFLFLITFSLLFLSSCVDKKDDSKPDDGANIDSAYTLDTLSASFSFPDSLMSKFDDKSLSSLFYHEPGKWLINGQWHMRDYTITIHNDGQIELVTHTQVSSGCLHVIGFYLNCFDANNNKIVDKAYFGELTHIMKSGEKKYCYTNQENRIKDQFPKIRNISIYVNFWVAKSCRDGGARCCTPEC